MQKKDPAKKLAGNWIIVYPEHRLKNERERDIYARYQDSVVNLYGLKLVSFKEGGTFQQVDSVFSAPGNWRIEKDTLLRITKGGKGFHPLTTVIRSLYDTELQLIHYLTMERSRIKVIWHLKKIEDDQPEALLFDPAANNWRKVPTASESIPLMKARLSAMLHYYGTYFLLVGKEASYFQPAQIPLPFNYYQHAVGLNSFIKTAFRELFYDVTDANTAYELLQTVFSTLRGQYETDKNFTTEYGLFLNKMAEKMKR
ncbi:MAG: hypothetical protein JWP88_879 [Flaviaesturariibacter sp.]|nr:hypothetical protein [Flaviaesturariibacter sp.]